jgi:T5SS/PEP-CTERM-associated repeat protein
MSLVQRSSKCAIGKKSVSRGWISLLKNDKVCSVVWLASYVLMRRGFPEAFVPLFTFLVFLAAVSPTRAQIPIPAGTLSQYYLNSDGTYGYGINTGDVQDGFDIGYRDPGGVLNAYGGGVLIFANAGGGSFSGQNYGGEAFLTGDPNSNDPGTFSGYFFQPAPIADDVVIIAPLGTDSTNDGSPAENDGLAGATEEEADDASGNYIYQGQFSQATSYTVDMGGSTIADLIVDAGLPPADAGAIEATPVLNLSGSFTATYQALIAGNDDQAVTIMGSSGGSFSTAFLDLYGQVNVTGGKLSGDTILIDSQTGPNIRTSGGELPSSFTEVDVSGSSASIASSDTASIGSVSDLPAELKIEKGASGTFNNVYVGSGDANSDGTIEVLTSGTFNVANLVIGQSGQGELDVGEDATDGTVSTATVNATGSTLILGQNQNSFGTLVIEGASKFNFSGIFTVGMDGTGSVDLEDGATLNLASSAANDQFPIFGLNSTGSGKLTVGVDSTLTASNLVIGNSGTGIMNVQDGGNATVAGNLIIGNAAGGNGTVNVDGANAGTTSSFGMTVGQSVLTINGQLSIGQNGGTGSASVVNGGMLQVNGSVQIDNTQGSGGLSIKEGGQATITSSLALDSVASPVTGLTVDGDDSALTVETILLSDNESAVVSDNATMNIVGGCGCIELQIHGENSTFDVTSSATLTTPRATIATGIGSTDSGITGSAELKVEQGGSVQIGTALYVNSGGIVDVTNGGSIQIGTSPNPATAGQIAVGQGGSLSLIRSSLRINNAMQDGRLPQINGNLLIGPGGSAAGVGIVNGNLTNFGGLITDGDDPGTITVNGNYSQDSAGTLVMEIDGTAPDTGYSVLDVTGEAALDGKLEFSFINGYAPKIGDTFDFLTYGTLDPLSASFSSVGITGLAAGFEYAVTPVGTGGTNFQLTALNNGIATTTPEPSTWLLLSSGLAVLGLCVRGKVASIS